MNQSLFYFYLKKWVTNLLFRLDYWADIFFKNEQSEPAISRITTDCVVCDKIWFTENMSLVTSEHFKDTSAEIGGDINQGDF